MPVVNSSLISDKVACWVLKTACQQAATWEKKGLPVRVGINLSPSLIASGALVETVESTLASTGLSPSLLELEVTEDILLNSHNALEAFRKLQALGIRIVFDDFGTGYASLSYLRKFPLDGLKIDRSFVSGLQDSSGDTAIVRCTIALAKLLKMSVIAEGIEDDATAEKLKAMGCEEGQGFCSAGPRRQPTSSANISRRSSAPRRTERRDRRAA